MRDLCLCIWLLSCEIAPLCSCLLVSSRADSRLSYIWWRLLVNIRQKARLERITLSCASIYLMSSSDRLVKSIRSFASTMMSVKMMQRQLSPTSFCLPDDEREFESFVMEKPPLFYENTKDWSCALISFEEFSVKPKKVYVRSEGLRVFLSSATVFIVRTSTPFGKQKSFTTFLRSHSSASEPLFIWE